MAAERRMPRRDTEGTQRPDDGTQRPADVYTKLRQISEKARSEPGLCFTSLAHLLNQQMLSDSFVRLRKDASAGIDGVTWRDYDTDRSRLLADLLVRLKNGTYRAQPVRRVYIDKEDGSRRPLGIPALEDKIVQRATATVLEAIYEQDFYSCSYGFRPGRGPHDALNALNQLMYSSVVNFVIDADIRGYFDSVVHTKLRELIRQRIGDPNVTRLIGKWLKAGVLENGRLLVSQEGTPQGSVISPLLANIYLHYALDEWWHKEVVPRLKGEAFLIRYADDFVLTFRFESDAQRVLGVLPKRLERFGLELHPEKTRLLPIGNWAQRMKDRGELEGGRLPTFDFLGFTHLYAKSRTGYLVYKVQTAAKRLRRALKDIAAWCRAHRHVPVVGQWETLVRKLRGHYGYYGRTHNYPGLNRFYRGVIRTWRTWLRRRDEQKNLTWDAYFELLRQFPLPPPRIVHSTLSHPL